MLQATTSQAFPAYAIPIFAHFLSVFGQQFGQKAGKACEDAVAQSTAEQQIHENRTSLLGCLGAIFDLDLDPTTYSLHQLLESWPLYILLGSLYVSFLELSLAESSALLAPFPV